MPQLAFRRLRAVFNFRQHGWFYPNAFVCNPLLVRLVLTNERLEPILQLARIVGCETKEAGASE